MNLAKVYEGVNIGRLGTYPDEKVKITFGKRGVKFCKDAFACLGLFPDKGYPYHNKGGIAVFGEVYCTYTHPVTGTKLEIILGETGPLYRTNGNAGVGYGPNMWIGGYPTSMAKLEAFTESSLAAVVRVFMEGKVS